MIGPRCGSWRRSSWPRSSRRRPWRVIVRLSERALVHPHRRGPQGRAGPRRSPERGTRGGRTPPPAGPRTASRRPTCSSASACVDGERWIRLRLPGRPNGRAGWVPADALRAPRLTRWALVIERRRLRIKLLRRGRVVWRAPVGIGAPGMETPRGRFWIREKFRAGGGDLRAVGVRHQRLFGAVGLAGRRRGRDPRHEPAGADPGPPVARLRAPAEPRTSATSRAVSRSARPLRIR